MKIIDLFSGIGGFSLAGHWMGWETVQFCEIDIFAQKVLNKNFPGVPINNDINTLTAAEIKRGGLWNETDKTIIVGGFPCQPFSVSGKRKGANDDRHLWPQMLRIIKEIKPAYIVGENVAGIVGMVLPDVLIDLEDAGYISEVFIIPACAVGAPHRRDRVWIVAYPAGQRRRKGRNPKINKQADNEKVGAGVLSETIRFSTERPFARPQWDNWERRPAQSPICGGDDGLSAGLVRNRGKQIKAYGNSVVPQVVYEIFKAIKKLDENYF